MQPRKPHCKRQREDRATVSRWFRSSDSAYDTQGPRSVPLVTQATTFHSSPTPPSEQMAVPREEQWGGREYQYYYIRFSLCAYKSLTPSTKPACPDSSVAECSYHIGEVDAKIGFDISAATSGVAETLSPHFPAGMRLERLDERRTF